MIDTVTIKKRITADQLKSELVDYAIDRATTCSMTTRFGSHAIYALKAQYGDAMLEAAWKLIGKPLKAAVDVHERTIDKLVEECRAKYAKKGGRK